MFLECLRDNYLSKEIMKPIRYRLGQTSIILDLLLTNEREIISNIQYNSSMGPSDHMSLYVEKQCNLQLKESETLKYKFHKADYTQIRTDLVNVNWNEMDGFKMYDCWNFFHDKIADTS